MIILINEIIMGKLVIYFFETILRFFAINEVLLWLEKILIIIPSKG